VKVLLNRAQRCSLIPVSEVEKILGVPVYMSFPNDYLEVHTALLSGKHVSPVSEPVAGFASLAVAIGMATNPSSLTSRDYWICFGRGKSRYRRLLNGTGSFLSRQELRPKPHLSRLVQGRVSGSS
jgi:hypothetical protein